MLEDAGALNPPVTFLFDASDPTKVDGKNIIVKALSGAGFDPQPRAVPNADKEDEVTQDPGISARSRWSVGRARCQVFWEWAFASTPKTCSHRRVPNQRETGGIRRDAAHGL